MVFLGLIILVAQCLVMAWLGRRYARRPDSTLSGTFGRAFLWSLVLCWTLVFAVGHGVLVFPLPSWVASFLALQDWASFMNGPGGTYPTPVLSPLLPVFTYIVFGLVWRR